MLLPACGLLSSEDLGSRQNGTVRHLVILYTNDEHGWMEPYRNAGGAAALARRWRDREGLGEDPNLLVLSGGDMWTGPALSSATEGESMVDVLNALGYDAAALGNHDFDFGLDTVRLRRSQSDFPFLAANLRDRATGTLPDFAAAYRLMDVNGVTVGIIGLATTETPVDTKPGHVAGLDFLPYAQVLPAVAAEARSAGAELLLLIGHLCQNETRSLAPLAAELGIPFIGGGHCHEEVQETVDGVLLVESGFFLRGYKRIELLFDTAFDRVVELRVDQVPNPPGPGDREIRRLMEEWRARSDPGLWVVIGYTDRQISRDSAEMATLLLEPWLRAWPEADVALADPRYVQQDLYPGAITVASLWGLLPTSNELVQVEVTGSQLVEVLESRRPLVAGMTIEPPYRLDSGEPVLAEGLYRVLVPDSLYAGGNHFRFQEFDPVPTVSTIDWRQPAIEWILSLGTHRRDPLADHLGWPR